MSKGDIPPAAVAEQAQAWLVRLRSGRATSEDAEAFKRWCKEHPDNARVAKLLNETWSMMGTATAEIAARDAALRAAAPVRTARADWRPGRRTFLGVGAAAAAAWLALRPPLQLWPAVSDYVADYRTGTGEQRQVTLSDRVTVEMNTQTRMNILAAAPGQSASRGINLLAGEAEIVASASPGTAAVRSQPVLVVAGRGRVRADAAGFDLRRTGDEVRVTCMSGQIVLDHPRGQYTLTRAQQLTYDNDRIHPPVRIDPDTVTAWRRGVLIFKDAPLAQVIDEINRYRPGKLILRNAALGEARVHAQVSLAKIDGAVELIGQITGAHLTKLPGDIVLLS